MDINALLKSPRYQKHIQKMVSWSPEQRAIFNSAMVDEHYGSEFTRRFAASVQNSVERERQRMSLDRAKTASDRDYSLKSDQLAYAQTQAKRSRPLDYANIAASAGRGFLDAQEKAKDAEHKRNLTRAILGG